MSYLDYLLTHDYWELSAEVRAEITEIDYATRKSYAKLLVDGGAFPVLPPQLRDAYRKKVANRKPTWISWRGLAAAGWLLAITAFLVALFRTTPIDYHYVQLPAEIEVRLDTVRLMRLDTVDRVVYRTRLLRDTFFAPAAAPRMLVVRDTVFLEKPETFPAGTVSVDPASLSLLVGSGGE